MHWPALTFADISLTQVIVGETVSSTVKTVAHESVFPEGSVAYMVKVFAPISLQVNVLFDKDKFAWQLSLVPPSMSAVLIVTEPAL